MELDELCKFKSPLLLPLLSVVFKGIYVKKVGGWFLSYWVDPLIWPSFNEIGEMACITTAWSSHGHTLKVFRDYKSSD